MRLGSLLIALLLIAGYATADGVKLLCGFDTAHDVEAWEIRSQSAQLIELEANPEQQALELVFDPEGQYYGAYLFWRTVESDWSAYDAAVLDLWNPTDVPVRAYVLIADRAWQEQGSSYWNRHNNQTVFPPGKSQWVIPVRGLFRGEAGSRNNDIPRDIDPDSIVRLDFGFGQRGQSGRIVIDNFRLVKAGRPAGMWAFDFGPASQPLMPGWIPIARDTIHTAERGYGWSPEGQHPWDGAARDTTFGTMLLQDFCEAGGYSFRLDVAPGRYGVTLFYENSGYWGGEQAQHSERRILANGELVWSEQRPDGRAHVLTRFEDVEPVNVDLWDTYMAPELARAIQFEVVAGQAGLTLQFEADRAWGSKIAALAVHQVDDAKASAWLEAQLQAVEQEFRRKAVCLDTPAPPWQPTEEWQDHRLVAWATCIEADITPHSLPDSLTPPDELVVRRVAVGDEYEPFCIALRPQQDLGECQLSLDASDFPLQAQVQVVHYNTSRGFNSIAYRVKPHTLRPTQRVHLPQDVTREIIVTVYVPPDAEPAIYRTRLEIHSPTDELLLTVPLELKVSPVQLDRETDFQMGFFGLMPPGQIPSEQRWDMLEQTLRLLQEHGMNGLSGGPSWHLRSWEGVQPVIDFGDMDRFVELCQEYGFDGPLNGYGGARFRGLHDRYERGRTGQQVEEMSGLPYPEALMRAWGAVDVHAREHDWPTILYAMCDETRVREKAERELDFMRLMAEVSAAFPDTVQTSGSYSVHFRNRPEDEEDMLLWHQRFFNALDISSLNNHDASVLAEAQEHGKQLHIYNQGRTRYSFGMYQWSEYRKGVQARWQWHLNVLHGYQFFDLDGREPDTAMICYGKDEIYPTIHFERCREGAEDFYLYQTLWARVRGRSDAKAEAGRRLLDAWLGQITINQRRPPTGFDADAFKAEVIAVLETLD